VIESERAREQGNSYSFQTQSVFIIAAAAAAALHSRERKYQNAFYVFLQPDRQN
jgi:hypothetical protein